MSVLTLFMILGPIAILAGVTIAFVKAKRRTVDKKKQQKDMNGDDLI